MDLKQFKSWKLLYEDDDLCFSKAVYDIDKTDVFFITFFQPEKMSIATKHLVSDHLHNFVAMIDEDDKLHLILKAQQGHAIKKFIKKSQLEYDDRVQIVFEFLKSVEKYDAFPYAIQIQLLDDEQLLISDEGVLFRELIDYTSSQSFTLKEVYKQLGKTLDIILFDAEGYHSQFIDNLLLGNHKFESLKHIKNLFKDVFIFEKPEAVDAINHEYTIIINDLEAGPPIKFSDTTLATIKEIDHAAALFEAKSLSHDDLQRELVDLLVNPVTKEEVVSIENSEAEHRDVLTEDIHVKLEDNQTVDLDSDVDSVVDSDLDSELEENIDDGLKVDLIDNLAAEQDIPIEADIKSFKEQFNEEVLLPEQLPKSSKQRYMDEENDLYIDDMAELFGEYESEEVELKKSILPLAGVSNFFKKFKKQTADEEIDLDVHEAIDVQDSIDVHEDEEIDLKPIAKQESELVERSKEEAFKRPLPSINKKWAIYGLAAILIIIIGFFVIKSLLPSEPIVAKFEVEPLLEDRVAFMNTSTGGKDIKSYTWEIYYGDLLVQTFTDKDLFPVFETEGDYTIVLKVQDKDGNWSESYSEEYHFGKEPSGADASETTETTETP